MTLAQAGVTLIDCDHKTPPAASSGYPYIAIPQLKDGHIDLSGVRRISFENFVEWTKKLRPQHDDVIVVRRCNSGVSAVIPKGLECAIGQNLVILRSNNSHIAPEFLRWLVKGEDWWEQVRKYLNVGAVFDSLKCKDIPNFELPIPPQGEQKAICATLEALDDRITLLRQTNTTLESIAQALFKSWFIDFDPVRAKAEGREPEGMDAETAALFPDGFEGSELGEIPRGWPVRRLESVAERVGMGPFGSNIKVSTFTSTGIPVLTGASLKDSLLTDDEFRFISPEHADRLSGSLVREGDIIITHRGTLGQVALIPKGTRFKSYMLSQSQFFVRAMPGATSPEYLAYFLKSNTGQHLLLANASQVGVPSISRPVSYLKSLQIIAPPIKILQIFSDNIKVIHQKIVSNRNLIQTHTELRDTLLPRLISGKLRLPDAQTQIQDAMA